MIDLIKAVLFSDDAQKAQFIAATLKHNEAIQGDNFEEKLHFLFHHASEKSLQIILAPFLREKVFQHLYAAETRFAQATKNEFIKCSGEILYNEQINNHYNGQERSNIYQDFRTLYDAFIVGRGTEIWQKNMGSAQPRNPTQDEILLTTLKTQFFRQFPRNNPATSANSDSSIWERIHANPSATQDFITLRQTFTLAWGQEQWAHCHTANSAFTPILSAISEEQEQEREQEQEQEVEDLGFPEAPSPMDDFNAQKQDFIIKHGVAMWKNVASLPEEALEYALQLKDYFIIECGQRQWNRIYKAPHFIRAFDEVKNGFTEKWGRALWDTYSIEPQRDNLNANIIADFQVRKKQFVDHWNQRPDPHPHAWEEAKVYPEVSPDSLAMLNRFKAIFIKKWGSVAWDEDLRSHRSNEYATSVQLETLGELFDFGVEVTVITNGVQRTTHPLRRADSSRPSIHVYCQDNIHYYVHDNGYYDTIGDGNCGYNGFAQWLKFLVLGQTPRRLQISRDVDPEIDGLVATAIEKKRLDQTAISTGLIADNHSFNEGITLSNIRIELGLTLNGSATQLARFIKSKANSLIQIIRAKKLPGNRIAILQKVATLANQFGKQDKVAELHTLQTFLLRIANTVYLPNTKDVHSDWTREAYETNIQELQACAPTLLPTEHFLDLGSSIITLDFNNRDQAYFSSFFAPKPTYTNELQLHCYQPQSTESEEDWLSAILCVASIFILITGMSCLSTLILLALISGPASLGILLMQYGFQAIATNLGAILGLAAPHAAVLAAGVASTMVTGLGFTLFKEFAPPSLLASGSSLPGTLRIF